MSLSEARALVVTVRLHAGRYHGEPEWPPSPARLFQALVAGSAKRSTLDDEDVRALTWLEAQAPPSIAAPLAWVGQAVKLWVPNNDLDAKDGDPAAISLIRTGKEVRPRIFDGTTPLLYVWRVLSADDEPRAIGVCNLARELFQLGRGVDFASATGELITVAAAEELLQAYPGKVSRPTPGAADKGLVLPCPQPGSLRSLVERHAITLRRFEVEGKGRKAVDVFQQPPKPSFQPVSYDGVAHRALFELCALESPSSFSPGPLTSIGVLTELLRDAAANRLLEALPSQSARVECGLVGRQVEGTPRVPAEERIRIMPLPSIGHEQADQAVRRMLVEVPAGNPLRADDVFWAFSGLEVTMPSGATSVVTRADDWTMLEHYGVGGVQRFKSWRSVTPVALPAARRRIEPSRRSAEAKAAGERAAEEKLAQHAVLQALRHAGVRSPAVEVHVQREPLTSKGARAEAFASGTRFPKERLWHVEVTFRDTLEGPLVLGDGRFLGLGIMEPVRAHASVLAFGVRGGLAPGAAPRGIALAMRRAVLARYQSVLGPGKNLPSLVTGHRPDGAPVVDEPHLAFAYDEERRRVLVLVLGEVHGRKAARELAVLHRALEGMTELRAGRAGRLELVPESIDLDADPLWARSKRWTSLTPYTVNRHRDCGDAERALQVDVEASCLAANKPRPRVRVIDVRSEPNQGLTGMLELTFDVAVSGPLLLGRSRYKGGGLFCGVPSEERRGRGESLSRGEPEFGSSAPGPFP